MIVYGSLNCLATVYYLYKLVILYTNHKGETILWSVLLTTGENRHFWALLDCKMSQINLMVRY